MAKKASPEDRLTAAAFKLLAKTPWRDLTLAAVAKAAKISLAALPVAGKSVLIGLILKSLGEETAKHYRPDAQSSTRERVFDVTMTWFDAANKHKPGLRALFEGLARDPLTLLAMRRELGAAANWLLTLAEADTGSAVALRALLLAGAIARALPVWFDDGPDMAKTMSRLDGDLRRGSALF